MLKAILIVVAILAVAVVAILAYAATRPDTFRVQRSTNIKAPADKIFPFINDFHTWTAWSPYEKRDPEMKRTFGGAPSGKGATYAWDGNKNVGAGHMEILDAPAPSRVTIKLDFSRPFEGHNTAEFTLEPQGDTTKVTWAMHGPAVFIGKVMGIFIDMDNMIGKDFEAGLTSLKSLAEK
jgi:carbon monoxide dehydrogenase subunit G